ncbi:MAG: hypothetical protein A49_11200 [Methyloceanibacter sp.]|nr:MAG: hypothetical protein A49_11200 [Methyloceanibacter sp.]
MGTFYVWAPTRIEAPASKLSYVTVSLWHGGMYAPCAAALELPCPVESPGTKEAG